MHWNSMTLRLVALRKLTMLCFKRGLGWCVNDRRHALHFPVQITKILVNLFNTSTLLVWRLVNNRPMYSSTLFSLCEVAPVCFSKLSTIYCTEEFEFTVPYSF